MNKSSNLSVVIPCFNEAETLPRAFQSIADQTITPEQVLFVDGGSDDGSIQIANNWSQQLPISVIHNPKKRQAPALNIALDRTQCKYLARLDGHSYWHDRYLEILIGELEETTTLAAAGGIVTPAEGLTSFQESSWNAMVHPLSMGATPYRTTRSSQLVDSLQSPIYRTEALEEIGGFREDIPWGEDDELHNRLRKSRWKLKLRPEAKLFYFPRRDLVSLWEQFEHYGTGRASLCNEGIFPTKRHYVLDKGLMIWTGLLFWNPIGWVLGVILGITYFLTTPFFSESRSLKENVVIPSLIITIQLAYWRGWTKTRTTNLR